MYGFQVPRNHDEAVALDELNGNCKWQEAEELEIAQLHKYKTFCSLGRGRSKPPDYKMIRCHFIYAVKHDGRHKAQMVAGGHLTDTPLTSVYSGVVSLRSIRIIAFVAELNALDLFSTDVGNAYLEAFTSEKVCI